MNRLVFGEFSHTKGERSLIGPDGRVVTLTPRVHQLLLFLLESGGRLITKDELMEAVWADCVVEEANLVQSISVLRKALGDSKFQPQYILTVPSRGYRFIMPVEEILPGDEDPATFEQEPDVDDTGQYPESQTAPTPDAERPRSSRFRWIYIAAAALVVLAAGLVLSYSPPRFIEPTSTRSYHQLTFERGSIWSARYAPGGQIVYGASLGGNPLDLFMLNPPSMESQGLRLSGASLLAVSKKGDLAILKNQKYLYQFLHRGTLARLPIGTTASRDVAENVQEADWSPDGESMAIVRWTPDGNRLEYPIGNVLVETDGYFSSPRFSPDARSIAYFDHPIQWDNRGQVVIESVDGKQISRSAEWNGLEGLAWKGNEVWFTASKDGDAYSIYALRSDGSVRQVESAPTNLMLQDIGKDGSALVTRANQQTDIYFDGPKASGVELSWLHLTGVADLSDDGAMFLLTHFGAGSGKNYSVYLRKTDGSPAVRLGDGRALALSPDSRSAVVKISNPEGLRILPTGSGNPIELPRGTLARIGTADWLASGDQIILTGNEAGRSMRSFRQAADGKSDPVPLTPEGIWGTLVSPDGKRLISTDQSGRRGIYDLENEQFAVLRGSEDGDQILRWNANGTAVYVFDPMALPIRIYSIDVTSGGRSLLNEIVPRNTSGLIGGIYLFTTPDGKRSVSGLRRYLMDLFEVRGLQ